MTAIAILLLLTVNLALGQDKYHFMNINYDGGNRDLFISIEGKEFSKEKIDLPKNASHGLNSMPLLNRLREYQEKGWEIITINSTYYYNNSREA